MPAQNDPLGAAVSEMANALQVAAPLATRLRRELSEQVQDAVTLEAAIVRAVLAVKRMRPTTEE